ncbi:MAG TPA: protein-disulfide reductase DsbD domain-containing protein [Verrucomicrobiae bacterium]|nr:protein-disulfide reductase DsbD domain-containing protein [Verrucomicrobiae bacterium]
MKNGPLILICSFILAAFAGIRVASVSALRPGAFPQAGAAVVEPRVYVSLQPVPQRQEFQIAVALKINDEYHMNSHKPTDPYLIPTTLTPALPAGFELLDTIYPKGKLEKFAFSPDKPLDVYSGSLILRLRLEAKEAASLGPTTIPMTLRYQACNQTACLPPVKLPIEAKFETAPAGTAARDMHPEIFAAIRPLR